MKRRLAFLVACALAFGGLPCAAQRVDRSAWPRQSTPGRNYDALHYRIALRIDLPNRAFEGEARVTVGALADDFETCALDAERFEVLGVSDEEGRPVQFDRTAGRLAVHFGRRYAMDDRVTFTVKYRSVSAPVDATAFGMPADYHIGFDFREATERHPALAVALSFQTGARHWFPCDDQPDDKATSEIVLTVPTGSARWPMAAWPTSWRMPATRSFASRGAGTSWRRY